MTEIEYTIPEDFLIRGKYHVYKSDYLRNNRAIFGLNNIYYPGCGVDTSLESAFKKSEITYLDNGIDVLANSGRKFYGIDLLDHPFMPEEFDSLFIQDLHFKDIKGINITLDTVRHNGLVLVSLDVCGEEYIEEYDLLSGSGRLEPILDLPYYTNPMIIAFRNV